MIEGIQGTPLKTTSVRSEGESIEKSNGLLETNAKNTQDSITISQEGRTYGLDLRTSGNRFLAYRDLSKDFKIEDEIDSLFEGYYTGKTSIEAMEHFAKVVSD